MTQPFPLPPIQPFERLQATDGLLMNAERWQLAHDYHRKRQNFHYQSLNQPGIVHGLGITLIPAPTEVAAQYRDGRWLQLQPGIAIDLVGNPIVVPEPINFRIATEVPPEQEEKTVYLVVKYVDPSTLNVKETREILRETFRIDEKTTPPIDLEVEVCRIKLRPGTIKLEVAKDVFFPETSQLDFRYRLQAQVRPQAVVQLAQLRYETTNPQPVQERLSSLLQSIPGLYPALQSGELSRTVDLEDLNKQDLVAVTVPAILADLHLLYLSGHQSLSLSEEALTALKLYLNRGGVLLAEVTSPTVPLHQSLVELTQQLGTPLESLAHLSRNHPLRTQPFLFAALPIVNQQPLQLLYGGGIILLVGELSAYWGLDDALTLDRNSIRTAQELGINLLHFAWLRRRLSDLIVQSAPATPAAKPKSAKSIDIFDKLKF